LVPAGNYPKAAVLTRSILQGEPQSNHAQRLSEQKSRVLMAGHFAANARLLEDVHRLQQQRFGDVEISYELFDLSGAREPVKSWVEIVQRVADLINRALLLLLP